MLLASITLKRTKGKPFILFPLLFHCNSFIFFSPRPKSVLYSISFFFYSETGREDCWTVMRVDTHCLLRIKLSGVWTVLSFSNHSVLRFSSASNLCVFFGLDVQQIHFSNIFSTEHSIPRLNCDTVVKTAISDEKNIVISQQTSLAL